MARKKTPVNKKEDDSPSSFASIAWCVSFIFFAALDALLLVPITAAVSSTPNTTLLLMLLLVLLGTVAGLKLPRTRFSVWVHETKHSFLSSFVGNRWKRMDIQDRSGSFTYQYTQRTARFNSFIALAPYTLPLLSLVVGAVLLAIFPFQSWSFRVLFWTIAGYELGLQLRDISPYQPDFQMVGGGFLPGVFFVFLLNVCWIQLMILGTLEGIGAFTLIGYSILHAVKR